MKKAIIAAAILLSASQAQALTLGGYTGTWTATGILTTQNVEHGYLKTEYVAIPGFKSEADCLREVAKLSSSDDFIGQGGTNRKVPEIQWNYDAVCVKINDL